MRLLLLLLGCHDALPLTVEASATAGGLEVRASASVSRVEVLDAQGATTVRRSFASPTEDITLLDELPPGTYTVRVDTSDRVSASVVVTVPDPRPFRVEVMPAAGQAWVEATGEVRVPVVGAGPGRALLSVTPGREHPAEVQWSGGAPIVLAAPGERALRWLELSEPLSVWVGDTSVRLIPDRLDLGALGTTLSFGDLAFPADGSGHPDLGRAPWRIVLSSAWWESATRSLGLTTRAADRWSPWADTAITLENAGELPVDVVVSAEVMRDGVAVPAFVPHLRAADGDTGLVSALLRVPAHSQSTAALPVFVDTVIAEPGAYQLSVRVTPLGGETPLLTREVPLFVQRGDPLAGAGFLALLLSFFGGSVWTVRRVPRWLEQSATSELMTIALFGCAGFVVGSASDLLSIVVSAALGPFATLLTGLVNDLVRASLHATLLTLLPRPGTLALVLLTGWLGRALTTGGFTPTDMLYTGASIALAEAFAWIAGLTRSGAWRDQPPFARFVRLSFGFGGASMLMTLFGLWMHIVLFRLYFADWYILLQTLGPGGLYVVIACALAVPFADSLRKVEA